MARLIIFSGFAAIALAEPASTSLNIFPSAIIGAGLLVTGLSYRRRARAAVVLAGILALLVAVVNVVQIATGSPLGPAPSEFAYLISLAAVILAAVTVLSDRTQSGPARWALAVPAACIALFVVSVFALPIPWLYLLPSVGFAFAGALLIRSRTTLQPTF